MSVAAAIRDMLAAGLTIDQALIAVEAMEKSKASSAKSNAERQAAWRARQRAVTRNENNVTPVTSVTPTAPNTENAPTHAEPEPNKTTYPTTSEANASSVEPHAAAKPKSDRAGSIAALAEIVGQERAVAVVDHRAKLKKPLTAYAAGRLAASLAKAPDPMAAADLMIERGWQGYQPDWGQNARGSPPRPAKRNTALDGLDELERRFSANVQPASHLRIAG